jgi:hypothetical protein
MAKPFRFKPYRTNVKVFIENESFSPYFATLFEVANAAALRADIGLDIGSDVQAQSSLLQELADLADVNNLVAIAEAAGVPILVEYGSTQQTITSGGALTLAHGLAVTPVLVDAVLLCTDGGGDAGYAENDRLAAQTFITQDSSGGARGMAITMDNTNLYVRFADTAAAFQAGDKSDGSIADLDNTKWTVIFRAFA